MCGYFSLPQVYSLMAKRLRELCTTLVISEALRLKIWTCFEYSLVHCTDLMMERHLDQLLMCPIYIMAKVGFDMSERSLSICNVSVTHTVFLLFFTDNAMLFYDISREKEFMSMSPLSSLWVTRTDNLLTNETDLSYVICIIFTDYHGRDTLQAHNEVLQVSATCQQKCKFLGYCCNFFSMQLHLLWIYKISGKGCWVIDTQTWSNPYQESWFA